MRWVTMVAVLGCTGCLQPATCVELLQCTPDGVVTPEADAAAEAGTATDETGTATLEVEEVDGATTSNAQEPSDGAATSSETTLPFHPDPLEAGRSTNTTLEAAGTSSPSQRDATDAGEVPVDGSSPGDSTPRAVQLVAGDQHTCALSNLGTVRCWGDGSYGQLGYGNTNSIGDDEAPAAAGNIDVGGKVVRLVAGGVHTCAQLDNGRVRCWGWNSSGQLGYANGNDLVGDTETPASMGDINVGGLVVGSTAGGSHTCALLETGRVRCWGWNVSGQLGYGNTDDILSGEAAIVAGDVNVGGTVINLAAGRKHTCAQLTGGAVRCWGDGVAGQLGYSGTGDIGDDEAPATAGDVNVGGVVVGMTAGHNNTCAQLQGGYVRCWGDGSLGQLGYGNTDDVGDDETPANAGDVNVGGVVSTLVTGGAHTCAVLDAGNIRCWGYAEDGQLGYGNTTTIGDDESPATAGNVNVGGTVVGLAAGGAHTCALLDTGSVRCWGDGSFGQLGYGNTDTIGDDESPASAGDVDLGW